MDLVADGSLSGDASLTGFPSVDRWLGGGVRAGDLVVLAGDVGSGKSALALAMAIRMAQGGTRVAFLSGEMSVERVMERAPDDYSRLLVVGIFTWLAVQAIINIGAMLGVLPLKGITLPFISQGGSSVVFVLALVGIVFQISRYTLYSTPRQTDGIKRGTGYESTSDRRRIRGALPLSAAR